jgi:hypothetical protein
MAWTEFGLAFPLGKEKVPRFVMPGFGMAY